MPAKLKKQKYKVALISRKLRIEMESIISGNPVSFYEELLESPGRLLFHDLILKDHATRHNIKDLNGELYQDGIEHARWPEIRGKILSEQGIEP